MDASCRKHGESKISDPMGVAMSGPHHGLDCPAPNKRRVYIEQSRTRLSIPPHSLHPLPTQQDMKFAVLTPFLFACVAFVRAADLRELFTIPAEGTIDTFTTEYARHLYSDCMINH